MPDLDFAVESVEIVPYAVAPLLNFQVRITDADNAGRVESVLLDCQIRLETVRRSYSDEEKAHLFDLFGEPERWGQTLKSMLWTHANVIVPPFSGTTTVALPVPCSFDFNVAATKYFAGLETGEAPLVFLFSGTCFYRDADGFLQCQRISWEKEAEFRLPVAVWRELIEHYYPNSAWLNLRRDVFERLRAYKTGHFLPTWEQTLEELLK
ncbi:MAG: hypothetical protein JSS81_16985 [Acidobacteria bacterium]|nr:hypothetical protein [Acidobacteriota bacterium]